MRHQTDRQRKANIRDVAREVDTSLVTIPRAVNYPDSVEPAMQQRVMDATEKLRYSPNRTARALMIRRTNVIGIIVNNLHDPFFYDSIKGSEMGAQQTSYSTILCSILDGDVKSKKIHVRYLSNGVVDVAVLYSSYPSDENVIKYPHGNSETECVMIKNDTPSIICSKLLTDNLDGTREVIRYFTQKGHRRIAHICGSPSKMVTMDRFDGYTQSMQGVRLEVLGGHIQYTFMDYKSGYSRIKALLELPASPSTMSCSDDAIVSYAVGATMDMGFRVPEDILVMRFDNQRILLDFYRGPAITPAEQPLYATGMDSIRLLSERLSQADPGQAVRKTYRIRVIEREAVGEYQ